MFTRHNDLDLASFQVHCPDRSQVLADQQVRASAPEDNHPKFTKFFRGFPIMPSTPPLNWDTEIFEDSPYRWKSYPSTVSRATRGGSKGNITLKTVFTSFHCFYKKRLNRRPP